MVTLYVKPQWPTFHGINSSNLELCFHKDEGPVAAAGADISQVIYIYPQFETQAFKKIQRT